MSLAVAKKRTHCQSTPWGNDIFTHRSLPNTPQFTADKLVMAQSLLCQRRTQEESRVFTGITDKEGKAVSPLLYDMAKYLLRRWWQHRVRPGAASRLESGRFRAARLPARVLGQLAQRTRSQHWRR